MAAITLTGFLALAPTTAHAAATWFVAPTPTGANTATCGTTSAAPCATVTFTIAKAAFADGDTINVAAGTYTDKPTFAAKGATILGAGTATTIFDGQSTSWAIASTLASPKVLSISNATLRNGKNSNGLGGDLVIAGSGTINATNVTFSGGTATTAGGGIYAQGSPHINLTNGTISGNSAPLGGAIYLAAGGVLTTNGTAITGNAANNGGGVYLPAGATATLTGGSLSTNTSTATATAATGEGGGAFVAGVSGSTPAASLTLNGVTANGNQAKGGASQFGGLGGAVFNAGSATINGSSTISSNTATASTNTSSSLLAGWGGGVYNQGTSLVLDTVTFSQNQAIAAGNNLSFGGGLATTQPIATANNLTFDQNTAQFGGGAYLSNNATLTNATFTRNSATQASFGAGGGLVVAPFLTTVPVVTLSNSTVGGSAAANANTSAVLGGGITVLNGATLNVNGSTLSHNTAVTLGGGAANTGILNVTSSTFSANSAPLGGGIYNGSGTQSDTPTLTVTGSHLDGNTASSGGGGLVNTEVASLSGSTVNGNSTGFLGGGIYNGSSKSFDTPTLTLTNTAVDGNTAASGAGGILTLAPGSVTATGGEVNGNSALGGAGVTVGDNGTASFDGTAINGNTATDSLGGGVLNAGALTLRRATLDGNKALVGSNNLGVGGAIYNGSNNDNVTTKLTVDSSTISNNQAAAAAALSTGSGGTNDVNAASIDNSTITGNSNTGTSVVSESIVQTGALTISRSTITGNTTAGSVSGALGLAAPTTVNISGSILSGNQNGSCTANGGSPVDGGYNLSDPGDTSCGFSAGKNDVAAAPQLGALANNGGPTLTELPGPASPALDKIPAATATGVTDAVSGNAITLCATSSKDQRGTNRPQGAKCDIGSVEVAQTIPVITTSAPSSGLHAIDYAVTTMGTPVVFTSTGTPQATLSETGGLPNGVTLVDNGDGTATLSGTPAAGTGGDYPITVMATNEAGTGTYAFDLKVHQAPTIGGPASDTYTVGQADGLAGPDVFSTATGFPNATLSTTSTLPAGVSFTFDSTTGLATISGTPQPGTGGVYTIVITGSNGTPPDASFTFTLTVDQQAAIAGPTSGTATAGHSFTSSPPFTTTGFPTPSLSATGLPAGVSLHDNGNGTGFLTGTPAAGTGGSYNVLVTAHNGVGTDATLGYTLTVDEAPSFTGPTSARAVVGFSSTFTWGATGFPATFSFSESGALPTGMHFADNHDGTASITGTPGAGTEGTYDVTLTVSNGISPDAVLHVALVVAPQLGITTTSLPNGAIGSTYLGAVQAIGGQPPYAFTLDAGTLPGGLHLNGDGSITGTPTGPTGTSTFTVRVTDSASPTPQTVTKVLSITIGRGVTQLDVAPVLIDTTNLLGIKVNIGFVEATLTGGTAATPIAGQTIVWTAGSATVCTAVTDAHGHAQCAMTVDNTLRAILNLGVSASYAGNATWAPATGSAGIIKL